MRLIVAFLDEASRCARGRPAAYRHGLCARCRWVPPGVDRPGPTPCLGVEPGVLAFPRDSGTRARAAATVASKGLCLKASARPFQGALSVSAALRGVPHACYACGGEASTAPVRRAGHGRERGGHRGGGKTAKVAVVRRGRPRQPCPKTWFVRRMGCAEGRSPFAGGTGVSPICGFISPFLARKGARGMVETVVGRRRSCSGAMILRQSPPGRENTSRRHASASASEVLSEVLGRGVFREIRSIANKWSVFYSNNSR